MQLTDVWKGRTEKMDISDFKSSDDIENIGGLINHSGV